LFLYYFLLLINDIFSEKQVALLAGGANRSTVELYSPTGNCNYLLAPLPTTGTNFEIILAYINQIIFVCGGPNNRNCWKYSVTSNSWSFYTSSMYTHDYQTAVTYNNKLYIVDDQVPEMFDPATNAWLSWPAPPNLSGPGPCMVVWKDTFLLFGGYASRRYVQSYNVTTKAWKKLLNPFDYLVPNEIVFSGCLVLPNQDKVLIIGSEDPPYRFAVSIYNIGTNTFQKLPETQVWLAGAKLLRFGDRVFAVDGHEGAIVDEFILSTNTWSHVSLNLTVWHNGHPGAITLPASVFASIRGGCIGL
jgi:hypothetical protein